MSMNTHVTAELRLFQAKEKKKIILNGALIWTQYP